jgi:TRAP-type C4-dicarboxylate transport system permease small subunit
MGIKNAVDALALFVGPVVNGLKAIGMIMLAAMMFLTATDVMLRYIFNSPLRGGYEVIEYLMAIVVPFGIAFCGHQGGHVAVDLLVIRLSKRAQAIIGSVTAFLSLGLLILITWQNLVYIKEQYESNLTSAVLLIPVYPFVGVVAIGSAVFSLVLLIDFLNFLSEAVKK